MQLSVESKPSLDAPLDRNNLDVASQSSSSMFDRNAFQQFSQKKLSVIMQNNESQDSRDKLLSNLRPKTALIVGNEGLDTANAAY